ncbi:MAG TPA: pitrilysin family protein [Verrucomicrobiae bacterium]|jgi:zinc protease|nr:pitrilysin family protein [Verrucomicrobiae bacterium]
MTMSNDQHLSASAEIPALPPGVTLTQLENGLAIIVREDHSAPVVSAQAWAMTGSINEGKWIGAGMSHVLEHMLFKGTTTRGAGRIDQEVQDAGGYMNAYTSFDRTVYYIDAPNTGAKVAIDILCDIMQHATLPADEMAKEKQVILREMDMNQDDPGRRSGRRLFETAYTRSPYRFTIIGYPDIYNELQAEDIAAYYRERYAPNNVFFVVVGDVKAAEVVEQIKTAYATTKARAIAPVVLPEEPRQTAAREIIEEGPIEMGHVHLSWHIPGLRHADVPILDVLAAMLGSGRSSRLYQEIREKKGLVNSIDAWTYNPGNPGLIGISLLVDADKFEAARAAALAEVERVKNETISPAEVAKVVKQFTSATLATRKTMQGQAHDLGGSWLVANDLNFSERYLEAVKRVTPADLQRVAREYLTASNRTAYALLPKGASPQSTHAVVADEDKTVQKFELANGLRLLVKESHRLPFVEFRLVLKGGVLAETAANNGMTQLAGRLLLKGTKTRSAEQIALEIESLGGSLDSFGGNNSFGVHAEVLREDFNIGLDLVADVLLNPTFPEAALERERQIQLAGIRSQRDQLLKSAGIGMRRALFGDGGYGLDTLGTEASVSALTKAEVQGFHKKFTVPNNCVLAIFGDVKADDAKAAVEKVFGSWKTGEKALAQLPETKPLKEIKRVVEIRDKKQAVLLVGFPGATVSGTDRYALELLQEACSDLGSRLFLRIRDNLGLAYYVGAQNFLGLVPGYFAFYVGTAPEKVEQVEQEILREAELLRAEGLTAEELKRAKAKIVGQKKIARQDLGGLAMTMALDELYGLGYAHSDTDDARYENITLEEIKAAAKKYLTPGAMVISVVKPE